MKEQLFNILTYFVIYSFLGWVMESIVRSIAEKKLINTGFLVGPMCPIYGIGAMIMLLFLDRFENNIPLLFIASFVLLTLWEYVVGVFLEKIFKTKYWDYSDQKFNFQGRVCLTNSICWGILGVLFVKGIHPAIIKLLEKVNIHVLHYAIFIISIVAIVDMIVSVIKVKNIKVTLEKIEELNKEIKEKLKEVKKLTKETEEASKKLEKGKNSENVKAIVESLKKKRNRIIRRLYRNVYRLKKAFPAINTKEITEVLNQKLDEIKNKRNK